MRRIMKALTTLLMAALLIIKFPMNVYAADNITYENFDYMAYANTYSDLLQAFGYNKQSLYTHYINYGRSEGRVAHAITYRPNKLSVFSKGGNESYFFDADRYAADYPDLYVALGKSKSALWNHYKTFGIAEGRAAYGTTDEVNAKLKVFDVASSITNDSMSDKTKIKAVHDWIINNTVYDYQNYLNNTIPSSSYEIEGVMLRGVGVCSGYAKTFDYFMHVLGIGHEYVTGVASDGAGSGGHAWNRVMIDGNWLYVDCTWDDPVCIGGGNMLCYDYFLISYEEISRDHAQQNAYTLY